MRSIVVGVCLAALSSLPACEGMSDVGVKREALDDLPNTIVFTWNAHVRDAVAPCGQAAGLRIYRAFTMVHVAMFDALNSVLPYSEPYAIEIDAPPGTSPEAAAAGAAYSMLVRICPTSTGDLDAKLAASLAHIPDGPAKSDGLAIGDQVAAHIFALREHDGTNDMPNFGPPPPSYTPPCTTEPGCFQLMPDSGFSDGQWWASWGNTLTWAVNSGSQFRVEEPVALTSEDYTRDFNEVKIRGARTGSNRTPEETVQALFFTENSVFTSVRAARSQVDAFGFGLYGTAKVLAHMLLAISDGTATSWESKYHYYTWRPITAIRAADTDGNPDTAPDAGWLPLTTTPIIPEYPSAHATNTGAAMQVLRDYFGEGVPFSSTNSFGTIDFASFSDYENKLVDARILAGFHFRTADHRGIRQGNNLARYILRHSLQPR